MKKRILSLLMVLIMAISMIPATIFAGDVQQAVCGDQTLFIPEGETVSLMFTPEKDGWYEFRTTGEADTRCGLYWGPDDMLWLADDLEGNLNFAFAYEMTAGETYILKVSTYEIEGVSVTLTIGKHTTHVTAAGKMYDSYGHWDYCCLCDESLSEAEPHSFVDNHCEICGAVDPTHQHDANDFDYSETRHWAACSICGEEMSPSEVHTFVDGVCSVCGADDCCDHEHDADGWINGNEFGHWWCCSTCGSQTTDTEPHDFDGAYCTVCDYYNSNHEHIFGWWDSVMEEDPDTGEYVNVGHAMFCLICGECMSEVEAHEYDEDNLCIKCEVLNPNHDHVFGWWGTAWEEDLDTEDGIDIGHVMRCDICGDPMGEVEAHDYVNGVCSVCSAVDPDHEHVLGYWTQFTEFDEEIGNEVDFGHYQVCDICNNQMSELEPHTYEDDVCIYCNAVNPDHEHVFDHWEIAWNYDEETGEETDAGHVICCALCGRRYGEVVPHEYEGNYCKLCNAVDPAHAHVGGQWYTEWDWVDGMMTDMGHCQHCAICDEILSDVVPHTYEHGRCTACGAVSKEHAHAYAYRDLGPAHGLVCTLCGSVQSSEMHTYGSNGICTVCGHAKKDAAPTAISIRNGENKELIITPTYSDGTSPDMTVQKVDFTKGDGSPDGWIYENGIIYTDAGVLGNDYCFARHEDGRFYVNYGLFSEVEEVNSNVLDNCEWFAVYRALEDENIVSPIIVYGDGMWMATGKTYDGLDVTVTLDENGNVLSYTVDDGIDKDYDVNGDSKVDADDLTVLLRHVAKIQLIEDEETLTHLDFDDSGSVDAGDVTVLAQYLEK